LETCHSGLDPESREMGLWIPAFAGMTVCGFKHMNKKKIRITKAIFPLIIFLVVWLFFDLCAYGSTDSFAVDANGIQLRVMTFNIRYGTAHDGDNSWENRRQKVFDVLSNHKSDVVGLQEALYFQIEEILKAVPQYSMVGVGRDDGKTEGEYCAILYDHDRFDVNETDTFWLSDTPESCGSITWGNACTRICTWARFVDKESGNAFYVYNVHLDHISQYSREKSAVLLSERINQRKHQDPFIVTGDFNVGEENPVVKYLTGDASHLDKNGDKLPNPVPLIDTFRRLHPDATEVGTFNQFKGNCDGEKIDYILAPSTVKVLQAQILHDNVNGSYPSDHFPIVARLILFNESIR
jgi:endonuclease/exonuclease/phosphatase family metal-dependent hydrolase